MTRHCNQRPSSRRVSPASGRLPSPPPRRPAGIVPLNPARPRPDSAASQHPGARPQASTGMPDTASERHDDDGRHQGMPQARDRALGWLRGAILSLTVLAAAAAVVSWEAQYMLVLSVKHNPAVAAIEAGIPDIGAVIFAALGVALALHGRRAARARVLNVGCVGLSLAMDALASAPGWRDLAIWVMPSAVYAFASDTLIGVVRSWVMARARRTGQSLADDEPTPMAIVGGACLWLIRLVVAPASTVAGQRRWVIDECPVAPGRKAQRRRSKSPHGKSAVSALAPRSSPAPRGRARPGKQARLIALAGQRHDLAAVPLTGVSRIANTIATEIGLSPGTARRVLLAHVRALQKGDHAAALTREEARS